MRFTTRLILTACLLAVAATTATAGPIRDRLAARYARPTCQPTQAVSAPTAPAVYQPAPVRQAVGSVLVATGGAVTDLGQVVRATSYDGLGAPTDAAAYQPIHLTSPLPTRAVCGPGGCR
jgi:hypothetical protein